MNFILASKKDLVMLRDRYGINPIIAILTNRGFHSLLFYRISSLLYNYKIPLLPLIFTRIIQILYSIDIDFKANIDGGIVIIHGMGLVIGSGVTLESGITLYHDVTLGRKTQGKYMVFNDGFPLVRKDCILGAGCKIFGNIVIGKNSIIGSNCVVSQDIADNSIVKVANAQVKKRNI